MELWITDPAQLDRARAIADAVLWSVATAFDRFDATSELSLLSAMAESGDVGADISPMLELLLQESLEGGWRIIVDEGEGQPEETIAVHCEDGDHVGIATSSTVHRRWKVLVDGARGVESQEFVAHHIIDPRTGRPVSPDLRTATVVADSAAHANEWSTALIIMGARAYGGGEHHESSRPHGRQGRARCTLRLVATTSHSAKGCLNTMPRSLSTRALTAAGLVTVVGISSAAGAHRQ